MTKAAEAALKYCCALCDKDVRYCGLRNSLRACTVCELFILGYEQAEKDILKIVSQITADLWGAPCNYSPLDEEICLCPNTHCDEICGTPEASDARCWEMYFNLKIEELNKKV